MMLLLLFSHPVLSNSLQPHGLQHSSLPGPRHLLKFAQVHVHCISDAIQPSHSLMPYSPSASIFPSIRDFPNELPVHIGWPKYWSFSFSISPSSEYSGLISLKVDWFDLLAIQGIELPRDRTTIWPSNYASCNWLEKGRKKTLIWKDTCISTFIAALFTIANIWKESKSPSTDK